MSAVTDAQKMVRALSLELPDAVWSDVSRRVGFLVLEIEALTVRAEKAEQERDELRERLTRTADFPGPTYPTEPRPSEGEGQ